MSGENPDLKYSMHVWRPNQTYRLSWTGLSTFPEDRASLGKTCACSLALSGQQAAVPTQGTWAMAMPAPAYYAIAHSLNHLSSDSVSFLRAGIIMIPFVNEK